MVIFSFITIRKYFISYWSLKFESYTSKAPFLNPNLFWTMEEA